MVFEVRNAEKGKIRRGFHWENRIERKETIALSSSNFQGFIGSLISASREKVELPTDQIMT